MATSKARKPAIQARQGHPSGLLDDIAKGIAKKITNKRIKRNMVKAGASSRAAKEFVKSGRVDAYRRGEQVAVPSASRPKSKLRGTLPVQESLARSGAARGSLPSNRKARLRGTLVKKSVR